MTLSYHIFQGAAPHLYASTTDLDALVAAIRKLAAA
jgi:hypothetical protein